MAEGLSLCVYLGADAVGRLGVNIRQSLQFAYLPEWQKQGYPLTPTLPLSHSDDDDGQWQNAAHAFFQNLLPEGQALDDASRALQISKSSVFGLLRAMGAEASGAVRVVPEGDAEGPGQLRAVSRKELSERIRQRQDVPFSVWDGSVRLSIAGYQDKLAVFESEEGWFLVDGADRASTHILKPDPMASRLAGLTSNEFICMRLAGALGLPVAPVRLEFVPEPVLVIERFDRSVKGESVSRIHVIDGCQALGVPPSLKYERPYGDSRDVAAVRTGASLPQLFGLGSWATTPAALKLHLLRWVIFQALIQNFDAHAKNLSFYWDRRGLRMAPAYDLVSVGIYPPEWFPQSFAMAFGDAFAVDELTAFEWAYMAHRCDIRPRQLANELSKMTVAAQKHAASVAQQAVREGADPHVADKVTELVMGMSQSQASLAAEISRVDPRLFGEQEEASSL